MLVLGGTCDLLLAVEPFQQRLVVAGPISPTVISHVFHLLLHLLQSFGVVVPFFVNRPASARQQKTRQAGVFVRVLVRVFHEQPGVNVACAVLSQRACTSIAGDSRVAGMFLTYSIHVYPRLT